MNVYRIKYYYDTYNGNTLWSLIHITSQDIPEEDIIVQQIISKCGKEPYHKETKFHTIYIEEIWDISDIENNVDFLIEAFSLNGERSKMIGSAHDYTDAFSKAQNWCKDSGYTLSTVGVCKLDIAHFPRIF